MTLVLASKLRCKASPGDRQRRLPLLGCTRLQKLALGGLPLENCRPVETDAGHRN